MSPTKPVNEDQAWFWTDAWQAGEREASEDIRDGRVHEFGNAAEAIAFLHEQSAKKPASP